MSKEEPATDNHDIVPDGYNIGRYVELAYTCDRKLDIEHTTFLYSDELVAGAVGTTSYNGVTYSTTAQNVTGLLPVGSNGVNHGEPGVCLSPALPKTEARSRIFPGIAIDGIVTVLTVTIQ